jgi:hypothetical protein
MPTLSRTPPSRPLKGTKALITFVGLLARSGALNEGDNTSATSLPETDDAIIKDYMRRHGHGTNDAGNDNAKDYSAADAGDVIANAAQFDTADRRDGVRPQDVRYG